VSVAVLVSVSELLLSLALWRVVESHGLRRHVHSGRPLRQSIDISHTPAAIHRSTSTHLPGAAKKSNPQKLFAVFSATAWNFCVKFYKFTWLFYRHLTAKRHLIIFKYDEVIDILAWLYLAIFACWKTFAQKHSKTASLKQHSEHRVWSETTQWTLCLMSDSHLVFSNCSPSAFVHVFYFSLPRPHCSRLRPNVRDRQTDDRKTDVRRASSLNTPTLGAGHNKQQSNVWQFMQTSVLTSTV